MEEFLLEIVTPGGLAVQKEVEECVAPGSEGEFGVLAGHAQLIAFLQPGELRYKIKGTEHYLSLSGGYAEVNSNKMIVLTEEAIKPED